MISLSLGTFPKCSISISIAIAASTGIWFPFPLQRKFTEVPLQCDFCHFFVVLAVCHVSARTNAPWTVVKKQKDCQCEHKIAMEFHCAPNFYCNGDRNRIPVQVALLRWHWKWDSAKTGKSEKWSQQTNVVKGNTNVRVLQWQLFILHFQMNAK